jgi:hypothetical protein
LHLAGESGIAVSQRLTKASIDGENLPFMASLSRHSSPLTLRVEFETARRAEDLVKLQDLFLWYYGVKLAKLDLSKAAGVPSLK